MPNIKSSTDLRNNYNEISKFCHESRHACDMVEGHCLLLMAGRSQKAYAIAYGIVFPHL